jgi:hypothetical protein
MWIALDAGRVRAGGGVAVRRSSPHNRGPSLS